MSLKNAAIIIAILLIVILVVGLILCRPMAVENYADGIFNFAAVSDITVRAWTEDPEAPGTVPMTVDKEDGVFDDLIDEFTRRGFGRTPGSIFSNAAPRPEPGDMCWRLTFRCTISQSTLTVEYTGGVLRLIGGEAVTVTTQDKEEWAKEIYELLIPLYPQPEPEPEPEPEDA